jgi:hypothetical protein
MNDSDLRLAIFSDCRGRIGLALHCRPAKPTAAALETDLVQYFLESEILEFQSQKFRDGGLVGFDPQIHPRLAGGAPAFFQVADLAGGYAVFKGGFPAAGSGYNVINRKPVSLAPAVSAPETVAHQDVALGKGHTGPVDGPNELD